MKLAVWSEPECFHGRVA